MSNIFFILDNSKNFNDYIYLYLIENYINICLEGFGVLLLSFLKVIDLRIWEKLV